MDDSWPVWILVECLVRKVTLPTVQEYTRVVPEDITVHYADFLSWDPWHENFRVPIDVLCRYNSLVTLWKSNALNHHPMCPSCAYRTLLKDVGAQHG